MVGSRIDHARLNLILAGFPKCGTTSLANWLGSSPFLAVSNPKETYSLCPEFGRTSEVVADGNLAGCFFDETAGCRMEAATLNAYSQSLLVALRPRPAVKVILIFRDAVDAVLSWHNQMRQAGDAFDESFSLSWQHGLQIEAECPFESSDGLRRRQNYGRMFQFGHVLQQWVDALGDDRVLVASIQELNGDDGGLRRRLNSFLGKDFQLAERPPMLNRYASIRYQNLYSSLKHSSVNRILRSVERAVPLASAMRTAVKEKVFRKPAKKAADQELLDMLRDYYDVDRSRAEEIHRQNLLRWPAESLPTDSASV